MAVLRLATEWSFPGIRTLAIERLRGLASAVDRIALAHAFDVRQWFFDAYVELCQRPKTLLAAEIRALEAEDVELIMAVRESLACLGPDAHREEFVHRALDKVLATQATDTADTEHPTIPFGEADYS